LPFFVLPALYAVFAWWFSTGAILYLDGLPRRTFRWSMMAATLISGLALYGLFTSRSDTTPNGAYVAFTSGLFLWAWLEMTYYMGFVTGPRRQLCPAGCSGWRHFGHAVQSSLYHELATIGLATTIYGATRGAPNQIALWTFVVLWWVQISAKLNVFLGVPNVSADFVPEHLAFLKSFLTKKPMNLLFPVSVTASVVLATLAAQRAMSAEAAPFDAAGLAFLATLMALAVLEHWFLVVPIPIDALWRWSLTSRGTTGEAAATADAPSPDAAKSAGGCRHSPARREAASPEFGLPLPHGANSLDARKRVAGLFAEADLPHPATPSIARRQR